MVCSENFKQLVGMKCLQLSNSLKMLQTSITFDQLTDLDMPIHRLQELGLTLGRFNINRGKCKIIKKHD